MDKDFTKKVVLPIVAVGWITMLCVYGWWVLLWTGIGMAVGGIIKTLKENGI